MQEFYLTIEQIGDTLHERFIDKNGQEQRREIKYSPTLFHHTQNESKYKDIYGANCQKKKFDSLWEAKQWMKRMEDIGQDAMGMDDFKLAYLSDKYPDEIQYDASKIRTVNYDIEVTAPEFPNASQALYPVDALTHYDSVANKFYVFDLLNSPYGSVTKWCPIKAGLPESEGGDEIPQDILDRIEYMAFDTEEELLLEYLNLWERQTPVILTGWNVEGFDNPYMYNRLKNVFGENTAKRLSPNRKVNSKIIQNMYGDKEVITPLGISVLDYLDLYKKFSFTNQASYKLDYVAEAELGVGKMKYDGPINKLRELDHQRYISYNIIDVARVQQIDQKRQFLNLSMSLGYYAKMQIQSVFSPIKTWDAIIFNSLKAQDKVIPQSQRHVQQGYPGAYVKEPKPSAYKYIMSFDLTSLYPSIIRQVGISPETIAGQFKLHPIAEYINMTAPKPSEEFSCSPNGWMFDKNIDGIIPVEITKVFNQRKEHKGYMLAAQRNMELIKDILNHKSFGDKSLKTDINHRADFDDEVKELLKELTEADLSMLLDKADRAAIASNTAQINRKLLINSLYGALGNIYFRYYDLRNASAITLFGQMAIQWIERKINEYLNKTIGTDNFNYVIAGDTDSVYVCVDKLIEKVGEDKFRDTNHLVDFLDKFAREKMEPAIDAGFREMGAYMNNKEHLMFMDREAISCPPLGSDGIGGFWTAKKRYALNVYDMEGTRYAEPKMKIMGLETQKSSTPKACQKALKECIRRMLQEGEQSLQEYYKEFESEFRQQDYTTIASVSSANNIAKYDDNGFPAFKCPSHIRGVLTYNRASKNVDGAEAIVEGEKVMVLPLMDQNPFGDKVISWPSGINLPSAIEHDVLKYLDYTSLFNKTFVKPLESFTTAAELHYEKRASLDDIFGW
ncbi:hypothetical protein fHeYen901_58 [Yersinia phage fHe-Yen9-01]|uniref:DNA-directed DNA polymerase n=1 Tax=Yersinia phage fHe-Yen9-01 TaxID=1965363 RepID=A0A1V0DXF6_9CAUD|nr:DNA polymerase [Yersinia phage fHe-Yen9-01]ARB05831.1 hypothetical protein fHeYen901_58 [Yersinia phage fHe-Yen9-01]